MRLNEMGPWRGFPARAPSCFRRRLSYFDDILPRALIRRSREALRERVARVEDGRGDVLVERIARIPVRHARHDGEDVGFAVE